MLSDLEEREDEIYVVNVHVLENVEKFWWKLVYVNRRPNFI